MCKLKKISHANMKNKSFEIAETRLQPNEGAFDFYSKKEEYFS